VGNVAGRRADLDDIYRIVIIVEFEMLEQDAREHKAVEKK